MVVNAVVGQDRMMPLQVPTSTPTLAGSGVTLRPVRPDDMLERRCLGHVPEIIRMFGGTPSTHNTESMSEHEATQWYEEIRNDPNPLHWVIEYHGRFAGTARLHMLSHADRSARYAVGLLDPTLLGQGVGTAVTELVLRYSFRELGLHRVELRVLDYNARALASYRKSGFVEEGRLRQAALVDGAWHDDVMMSIVYVEWENSRDTTPGDRRREG